MTNRHPTAAPAADPALPNPYNTATYCSCQFISFLVLAAVVHYSLISLDSPLSMLQCDPLSGLCTGQTTVTANAFACMACNLIALGLLTNAPTPKRLPNNGCCGFTLFDFCLMYMLLIFGPTALALGILDLQQTPNLNPNGAFYSDFQNAYTFSGASLIIAGGGNILIFLATLGVTIRAMCQNSSTRQTPADEDHRRTPLLPSSTQA